MSPLATVITVVGSLIGTVLLFLGGRYTARQAARATRESDSAEWERRYRAGAEKHLFWDGVLRGLVLHQQDVINSLCDRLGVPRPDFEPIPEAPPLFPEPPERKAS